MRIFFLISFFFFITLLSVGQKTTDDDSLFYCQYYKINSDDHSEASANKDYKIFGNHDNLVVKFFSTMLWFYKSVVSEQLASECGFVPSCSLFSYQAIHDLGLLKGIFLTADRLTRCNGFPSLETPPYLIDDKNAKVKDIPAFYKFSD
jgi:putative component of membrane protein insertase Oxa1/YidC/SpoIIIJ protein YidD